MSRRKRFKITLGFAVFFAICLVLGLLIWGTNVAVLNPAGPIAAEQRELIIIASLLSLFVVVPVFWLTFFIAWKYRASNKKATYRPDWDHHRGIETLWWVVPLALITVLSVITWRSSHQLDPFRPLASDKKPLTIQVVALQWKWLFIYPEQNIATVNFLQFPEDTPINFVITSDAPMNSFWIPQLGGQIYAMTGMSTKLHVLTDQAGEYRGVSANLSGAGFADMVFTAKSTDKTDFERWVNRIKTAPEGLNSRSYHALAKPSTRNFASEYASVEQGLYDTVVTKYMSTHHTKNTKIDPGAHHEERP